MAGFLQALPEILKYEGGYADHPSDPGGATMKGVTEKVYHDWRRAMDLPLRPVKEIGDDEVQAIYHQSYWIAGKCDALPWPLSMVHFDGCVNLGVGGAVRVLQRALEVAADGKMGPATLAEVKATQFPEVLEMVLAERERYYRWIVERRPASGVFLAGWLARIGHVRQYVAGYLAPAPKGPLPVERVPTKARLVSREVPLPGAIPEE